MLSIYPLLYYFYRSENHREARRQQAVYAFEVVFARRFLECVRIEKVADLLISGAYPIYKQTMTENRKIRVLECIRQGKIGGGETHLLDLVENLDKSQFEPVVLSFTDGPMIKRLGDMGIKTHIIHTEKPFDFTKWKAVKKLLIDEKIDLVHAH